MIKVQQCKLLYKLCHGLLPGALCEEYENRPHLSQYNKES